MNKIKKKNSNFTQVSNALLRDKNISFKAKGLFCYMFSMEDNWNFTMQSIATQQKDGLDSIKSAMDELKLFGYVKYEKLPTGKGLYYLDDEPKVENPNVENPNLGKSTPIKNTNLNKNNNNKSDEDFSSYCDDLVSAWNVFAKENNLSQVVKATTDRKKKIKARQLDFKDFKEAFKVGLLKANDSSFLLSSNFFSFDWLIQNGTNLIKVLEDKYKDKSYD